MALRWASCKRLVVLQVDLSRELGQTYVSLTLTNVSSMFSYADMNLDSLPYTTRSPREVIKVHCT